MLYTLLALIVAVVACFIVFRAIKLLWLNSWFIGWLKGMFGLSLLLCGAIVGLLAYDVYSYHQILLGQPVATINFEQTEEQHYNTLVVDATGEQRHFALQGDQWQLDARVIKWKGYFSGFGITPAFRLDRLSGRYYDIEKESAASRLTYSIAPSLFQLDVWKFIYDHPSWFSVVDATYGTAKYLPMRDGALYEIILTATGLNVRPLNDVATKAMDEWK